MAAPTGFAYNIVIVFCRGEHCSPAILLTKSRQTAGGQWPPLQGHRKLYCRGEQCSPAYKEGDFITISKIISLTDELRPNRFSDELKIAWLSDLDRQLHDELLSRFEGAGEAPAAYTDQAQELLIGEPYGRDIYCFYLQSCMDRENGETGRYNQSAALYNAACAAYQSNCLRSLRPKSPGPFKLKGEAPCPSCPF